VTVLGAVFNNTRDEAEEIKARILAAYKLYYSLQTISRSKQIYRNNKIKLYKTLISSVFGYGNLKLALNTNDRT
jgi:hypothetical protein